ncbi:MAG TPA: HEAT repeat domain-containing protein [Phycisphaerae bacterium]|nr:HEAT repeat domain-containing protein [Phycisphaerae bacterium]
MAVDVEHIRRWLNLNGLLPGGQRAAAVFTLAALVGCAAPRTPYPESFNSFRPEERILAARHAAEINDPNAIPLLVDRLEDDDSAVRMFAIISLEKLTGIRLGYDYAADDVDRARAVERWRRQVREGAMTQPAAAPAGQPRDDRAGRGNT